jgi:hypothetical protein
MIIQPISAATPTALAAISVAKLATGTMAWVTTPARVSGAQQFVLSPATAGAANADNVVATLDDTSRQWIHAGILNGKMYSYITDSVDMTTPGLLLLMPAIAGYYPQLFATRTIETVSAGSLSTQPTWAIGNNANHDNLGAQATTNVFTVTTFGAPGAFSVGAPVQCAGFSLLNPTQQLLNMSGAALYFRVVTGATGTGGFQLKARIFYYCLYVPV